MGKKGGWISAVKKVLTFESKDTKDKKLENPKNKWLNKKETAEPLVAIPPAPLKVTEKTENEQNMHAYSVVIATAAAAEAAAAAARAAAAEVARLTVTVLRSGRSKEEAAAVKIQSAFRAHLARKALRALRGLARLKSMIQGQSVQRQSMITLKCMQTLTRVQTQIRSRRVRMSEDNLALQQKNEKEVDKLRVPASMINENLDLQQQLQQKCEKESEKMKAAPASTTNGGEGWNASAASKEQIEAKLQHKEEAAKKRERALAYAHSHQSVRKNPSKPGNPKPENQIYTDQLTETLWGWSWLERWNGTRPWEKNSTHDQYPSINDENTSQKNDPTPNTKPPSPTLPPPRASSVGPKPRPVGLKVSGPGGAQPGHQRRHTIGGSLVKDGDKNPSQKTVSSKGKSRVASRLGNGKTDKGSFGSSRKQLS